MLVPLRLRGRGLARDFRPVGRLLYERMFDDSPPHRRQSQSESCDRDELAEIPLELIEREIESLAAQITAGSARWLELIAEFDRRDGWWSSGCRSICDWVAWRCGLNSRSAREHVRVARALRELPLIRAAFASGELSYSKVRALTRVADAESEEDLLELARHATAAQLERMVRAARKATAEEADDQHRDSYLRWQWDDDDGCLEIQAKLPPEEGAQLLQALEAARGALREQRQAEAAEEASDRSSEEPREKVGAEPVPWGREGGSAEPLRPPEPTNAECLAAVAEVALARPPSGFNGLAGGERHQVMVHIDAETLVKDSPGAQAIGTGNCSVARGPGIAPEVVRRICCDSSLVPLVELDGQPLAVGHQRRSIPSSIRRALIARDGCCQFPGCERHRFVDAHHIRHWAHGGETKLDNLVLLCRHHHRLVHEGGFYVTREGTGPPVFRGPDGSDIANSPKPPWVKRGLPRTTVERVLTGTGEKMDLSYCVDAVIAAMVRPAAASA